MSKHPKVTRYALVGTGSRAFMFSDAMLKPYKDTSSLVAICDVNQHRMDFHNEEYARKYGAQPVPTWLARDFDRMIAAHAISTGSVLVTNNSDDFRDIPDLSIENWAAKR